jgi:hypothetical protein
MQNGTETLDVVVRGGGLALTASSVLLDPGYLMLAGTLMDPEFREPTGAPVLINTVINVSLAPEFASGAHVERETEWTLETDDGQQIPVTWLVESRELPEGYAFHDARVRTNNLDIRAFAIEDLVATVGVGLASGIAGLALLLYHKRTGKALKAAEQQFRECLESGGLPTIRFGVDDEASITPDARFRIRSGARYEVRCAPGPR